MHYITIWSNILFCDAAFAAGALPARYMCEIWGKNNNSQQQRQYLFATINQRRRRCLFFICKAAIYAECTKKICVRTICPSVNRFRLFVEKIHHVIMKRWRLVSCYISTHYIMMQSKTNNYPLNFSLYKILLMWHYWPKTGAFRKQTKDYRGFFGCA